MSLPEFINSRSLCDLLNQKSPEWTYTRVQAILRRMGVAHEWPGVRGVYVRPEDLASAWPEMYETILENLEQIKPFVHGLKGRTRTNVGKSGKLQRLAPRKKCTVQSPTDDHTDE